MAFTMRLAIFGTLVAAAAAFTGVPIKATVSFVEDHMMAS
jgi:hypothetical protein